jgi:hypothetical protein
MLPESLGRGVLVPWLPSRAGFCPRSDGRAAGDADEAPDAAAEAEAIGAGAPDRVVPSWRGPWPSPTVGLGGVPDCWASAGTPARQHAARAAASHFADACAAGGTAMSRPATFASIPTRPGAGPILWSSFMCFSLLSHAE